MDSSGDNMFCDFKSVFEIDKTVFDEFFKIGNQSNQNQPNIQQNIQNKVQQHNIMNNSNMQNQFVNQQQTYFQNPFTSLQTYTAISNPLQNYPNMNQIQSQKTYKTQKRKFTFTIRETRPAKQNKVPKPTPGSEDAYFERLIHNSSFTINPKQLNFIPNGYWPDCEIPFGDIVADFFQRKNNPFSRFHMKLYNALRLAQLRPDMKPLVGVEWVSKTVLMVNKVRFARLLGISTINGSLFHKQGNFTTHGFTSPSAQYIMQQIGEKKYDETDLHENVFLYHKNGIFTQNCSEMDLLKCKWGNPATAT